MSNENLAKYLRLLEDEREAQTVRQVRPSPFTPTNLIRTLIQEKSTTNRKEVWALEIAPKNGAFTTAHEQDGDSRGRKNNGFLDSLGEPKVEVVAAAGVVILTETFSLEANPQGRRREVHSDLLTPSPIHVLTIHVPVQVRGVDLESNGDLVVQVGGSQSALAPMKSLLDFGAPEGKFLVLRQRPPDKALVTKGTPLTPEAFRSIQRGINNSVSCSMVDCSRSVLHVVEELLQESQLPSNPNTLGGPSTPLGVSEEVKREHVYRLLKGDIEAAANCVLNLPFSRTIPALLRRFSKEQVKDAFFGLFESNGSSSSLKSQNSGGQVPGQTGNISQTSYSESQSDLEYDFDPLNAPILGPSSKSNSQKTHFNDLRSRNSTSANHGISLTKTHAKTPVNGSRVRQEPESLNRRTRSLEESSIPTPLTEEAKTVEGGGDTHFRSLDLIRKTMKEATGYGRKVAFIVSTDSLAISLSVELDCLNFKACVVVNAIVKTCYYRDRLKESQAVILPLKDWKRLSENDKLATPYVVIALDAQQHNEERENLRTSMDSDSLKDRKFEKVVTVHYVKA